MGGILLCIKPTKDINVDISAWILSNVTTLENSDISLQDGNTKKMYLTIPATNGNGISNTETRLYGANENTYIEFTDSRIIVTVASS